MANRKSYRGIRFVCITCLLLATLGLVVSVSVPLLAGTRFSFNQPDVSLMDVQLEISKGATGISKQLEALRDQFPTFDAERWGQARELIGAWVDELGATSTEKAKIISEIRVISEQFAPDQRTQAIDAYYRLKKDKLLSREHSLQSWVGQFGTLSGLFFSLLLIGFFMLVLMLIEITGYLKRVTVILDPQEPLEIGA